MNTPNATSVLIIDDDPDFVLLLRRTLTKAGIPKESIEVCANGRACMDLLLQRPTAYSFAIIDLHMPLVNGLELLGWIRTHEPFKHMPAFILTTGEDPNDVAQAYRLGASGYIIKPLGSEELRSIAEAMLNYVGGRRSNPIPGSIPHPRMSA